MYNYDMRQILLILLSIIFSAALANAKTVTQRVGTLEKKVTSNTRRITALEKNTKSSTKNAAAQKKQVDPKHPVTTYYISAVQKNAGNKMGVIVTLVVENSAAKPIYAFSGDFIFRTEDGTPFFRYPYIHSDAIFGYKRARILIPVDSAKYPRAYLRFIRDKKIQASLENQLIY